MSDLIFDRAAHIRDGILNRDTSCMEVMQTFLARIEDANPEINAICTLDEEGGLARARDLDEMLARGEAKGRLFGLPIAIKDLVETKGMRTTFGSPLFKDHVPSQDQLFVERLKQEGAIVIGKTNTPEFGAGSHTFNRVFGATRNPYDTTKSAGGSSGGAAAALASGMLPLADGSDLGGSLRNPASFCNVVGFRPSPGRIPRYPSDRHDDTMSVLGPMGRTVEDAALLLSVMAGRNARDPLSLDGTGDEFLGSLRRDFKGARIAWSPDLGHLPVDRRVTQTLEPVLSIFEDMECIVEQAEPNLKNAEEIFLTLRSELFVGRYEPYGDKTEELFKDTIIWNLQQGLDRSVGDMMQARTARAALYQKMLKFFENYDYLILPAAQLPPFPVEWDWPREIEGHTFDNYLQWMQICCAISLTHCPCISVPAGFTSEGLPIGLQIVGKPRHDRQVLQIAHAFEQATEHHKQRPPL